MKRFLSLIVLLTLAKAGYSGVTTCISLDCREGARVAEETEKIAFSPYWEAAGEGAEAVVCINGEEVARSTEAGVYEWTPTQDGLYTLTHKVVSSGEQVGEALNAYFIIWNNTDLRIDSDGVVTGIKNKEIETITIPAGINGIAADAFKGATNLKHLIVESLGWAKDDISSEVFADCQITEITLNESVGRVDGSIFKAIPTIERINVLSKTWWYENVSKNDNPVVNGTASLYVDGGKVELGAKVTSVKAQQRYPWNGVVDIEVQLSGTAEEIKDAYFVFTATNVATKAGFSIAHIEKSGEDVGSGTSWTRKFIWDAKADVGAVKIDDVDLTVDVKEVGGIQLWEGGPYWAECNVGATKPEEYGYYFWWGDTVGYKRNASNNGWVSVQDGSSFSFRIHNCRTYGLSNSWLQSVGYIDSTGNLVAAHDAATAHLGAPWRMPTEAEFSALQAECKKTWTTRNGVSGCLITGRGAYSSKSIFLPAAGHGKDSDLYDLGTNGNYWTSTPYSSISDYALYLPFNSSNFRLHRYDRFSGTSVRPLRGFADIGSDGVGANAVTTQLSLDCREGLKDIQSEGVKVRYDASWYEGADSVRVLCNGVVVADGVSGDIMWKPDPSRSLYQIELKAMKNGEVVAAESVAMCLGYIRNVTARQLWPHNKVEISYEVAEDIGEVVDEDEELVVSCATGSSTTTTITETPTIVNTSSYKWTQSGTQWQSGGKGVQNLSASYITASVSDAMMISFRWKVSSESSYDFLHFYVDNTEVSKISGSTDWTTVTYNLSSGAHTLKWSYTKDGSQDSGSDCGWVDSIQVTKTVVSRTLIGDTSMKPGLHRVVWDMEADGVSINTPDVRFKVGYGESQQGTTIGCSEPTKVDTSVSGARSVVAASSAELDYSPIDTGLATIMIDGEMLLSATNSGSFVWQPKTAGEHTLEHLAGTNHWTRTVNVTSLAFAEPPMPNPPTAEDANIKLAATSRSVVVAGGTVSITTSGSGTWNATTSADWITFNGASSKSAGQNCIVRVAANTEVESRTGYVYISGHVFTITQAGVGAELEAYAAEFGPEGGEGEVLVLADGQLSWQVKPESEWISVRETSGTGEACVHFTVAPFAGVSDRTGYLTIAGRRYEVRQVGRELSISHLKDNFDYQSHVVEIDVTAFGTTEWRVTPSADWISVVAPIADLSCGSGKVALFVEENPSYLARTAFVMIGTERYDVEQTGRSTEALTFSISPGEKIAPAQGLEEDRIAVLATPGLPWTVESAADWLVVSSSSQEGTGNGQVVYAVAPNPEMSSRTGTIVITPEPDSGKEACMLTVTQAAPTASISSDAQDFAGEGGTYEVEVSVGDVVNWTIGGAPGESVLPDWVKVEGALNRLGPGKVKITVDENHEIEPRSTIVIIAGQEFAITQRGRTVEVEYENRFFSCDGGDATLTVRPNGEYVNWTAVASDLWITIWAEDGAVDNPDYSVSGTSVGTIGYYVEPYEGETRTGTITVGDKVVYITQRANNFDITPSVEGDGAAEVSGDAETGFVVKPSAGTTEVVITIPEGVAAEKVTIEVLPSVETVKANGATIKVVKGEADITGYLTIPAAVGGVINLGAAVVKPEIIKEALDPEKGAVIDFGSGSQGAASPTITTAETRPGLTYTLFEGETLDAMVDGDSKLGDGSKWTPEIKVKGGASGFYTIKITK